MTGGTPAKIMHSCFYLFIAILFLQPLCSKTVLAKDMLFVPRASLTVAQYEFTKPTTINGVAPNYDKDFPEVNFEITFKFLGVGGTLFKNNYYLDLFYQRSSNESTSFAAEIPDTGSFTDSFDGRRKDLSLTFGKKILDGRAGIYAGYKEGKTGGPQSQGQHMSFEEEGFFIGGNYGWLVSDIGVISLNLAYAKMDGNLTQKSITGIGSEGPIFGINLNGNGDADGLSYGATWTSRLTDHFSYSAGLEVRQYTFGSIKDVNQKAPFTTELEETFNGVSFSMYYSF